MAARGARPVVATGEQPRVTACVIARDEEARLPDCLASVAWCDEVVVVVDSRSADLTAAIARERGCRVIESAWVGFAAQRNVAIDEASGDWILEVDADERITSGLADEIRELVGEDPDPDIAAFPIREVFLGELLGPAAKYPNYRHRLFRRGAYRHDTTRLVHEGLWPRGTPVQLRGEMLHIRADTLREAIADSCRYARLAATQSGGVSGAHAVAVDLSLRPLAKLLYRLIVYGGWRDGWRGLTLIALESWSDAAVATLRLRAPAGAGSATHFGHATRPASGQVVGLAAGSCASEVLAGKLERHCLDGKPVALITDAPPATPGRVRVRRVERFVPFAAIRALEAEDQLMPIEVALAVGVRARVVMRLAPRHLRGARG
jgi:hypothetical protein